MAISVSSKPSNNPGSVQRVGTGGGGGTGATGGPTTPLISAHGVKRLRTVIAIWGPQKSGKTHLAYSGRPPILHIDLENGSEGVAESFPGKTIMRPNYDPVVIYPSDSIEAIANKANVLWSQVSNDALIHIQSQEWGTVIIDTGSDLWWLLRLARFGRVEDIPSNAYGALNFEMQSFFTAAMGGSKTTVIFLHREKEAYKQTVNPKSGKQMSVASGEMKLDGWNQTASKTQVILRTRYEDTDEGRKFFCRVADSRFNPQMIGMEWSCEEDNTTLAQIQSMLVPGTSVEEWS